MNKKDKKNVGDGSEPKKGLTHDPLDGITPEMYKAAQPKIKGLNPPPVIGTNGPEIDPALKSMFIADEWGQFKPNHISWKSSLELKHNERKGLTIKDLEEAAEYIQKNSHPDITKDKMNKMVEIFKKEKHNLIDLVIYHADGYFVSETTSIFRPGKTKTGWKGTKDFIEKNGLDSFRITYNGVKYETEDNEKLFKRLFENEL